MFTLSKDFLLLIFNLALSALIIFGLYFLIGSRVEGDMAILLAYLLAPPFGIIFCFVLAFLLFLIEIVVWDKLTTKPKQAQTEPEIVLKPKALPKRSRKGRNKNP